MQPLTPFGDTFDWRFGTDYLGEILDPKTSELMATGEIHPLTLQRFPREITKTEGSVTCQTREENIERNSEIATHILSPSRHDIQETVWSSICSVDPQSPPSVPTPIEVSLEDISPIASTTNHFSSSNKEHSCDSVPQVPMSTKPLTNISFEPLSGVESLYRRQKRVSKHDEEMVTEFHPWSSKKAKRSDGTWIQSHPEQECSIHNTLREASRSQNQENPFFLGGLNISTVDNEFSSEEARGISRFRHAGILKYQPYHLYSHLSPFVLPQYEM